MITPCCSTHFFLFPHISHFHFFFFFFHSQQKLGGLGIGEAPAHSSVVGRPLPPLPTEAGGKAQSQEEYFEELARQAQAGRGQTDSMVKVRANRGPNNPQINK